MPYISEGQHITSPVSIRDVQQCLGSSSNDLATLCMRPNINMWSVSKPVYFAKVAQLTDADLKTGRTISGYQTSYGIKKRASAAISDYLNTSTGVVKSEPWQYDKPVEDGINVFRLTDFYNYWHTAVCAMWLTLDGKDTMFVPMQTGVAGDTLHFQINFRYLMYEKGAIASQQLFGSCLTYHPHVLFTCLSDSHVYQYVQCALDSQGQSASLPIGSIGGSSSQSGLDINVDTARIYAAMRNETGQERPNCLITSKVWTASLVLLSGDPILGTPSAHTTAGREIVRLEYETGVDRKNFTIIDSKRRYISSMSMTIHIKPATQLGHRNWFYISSISVTAEKLTSDSITFSPIKASMTCPDGDGVVGSSDYGVPDAPAITISDIGSLTFTGTGSVTKSLAISQVLYKMEGVAVSSHPVTCSLTLKSSNYGEWSGTCYLNVVITEVGDWDFDDTSDLT